MAPIVSVNLSESAYAVYRRWKDSRNGSRKVSFAIVQYQLRRDELAIRDIGDTRIDSKGEKVTWGEEGWE
jgi:hypothetical protein